jgi:hypothetical protein
MSLAIESNSAAQVGKWESRKVRAHARARSHFLTAPPAHFLRSLLLCLTFALAASAALIPEPATTFYGKIFDLTSGQPYQLSEGDLTWVIRRADGVNQVLHTKLFPLNNGEFSYQLDVPHQVLSPGLSTETGAVPLRAVDEGHAHSLIAVNGRAARILGPNGSTFEAAQARRTATYRLDLAVHLNGADADADGLPDWWEAKHLLTNPYADPDGDGLNNLAEFRNGTDPNHDDRVPGLETKEIRAYADGTTLVRLRAVDTDSAASNLVYTVLAVPETGTLSLRNAVAGGGGHDLVLAAGAAFSQADILAGRVIYAHPPGADVAGTSFTVRLNDEDSAHAASTNRVAVLLYRPIRDVPASAIASAGAGRAAHLPAVTGFPADEQSFVGSYLLGRELGYVISDSSAEARPLDLMVPSSGLTRAQYTADYVPRFGPDRMHVLLGGQAGDRIIGSMENDILIGGPGDDTVRGNAGADVFVIAGQNDGNDTIEDFSPSDNDVIDLSRVLTGQSTSLNDYVQVTSTSSNTALRLNFSGSGATYSDMVLTLSGVQLGQNDLYTLTDNGNLVTGDKLLPASISITASDPNASENGPASGEFTVTRSGSAASAVTVNLQITGSAANGVDYRFVSSSVNFAAGQRSVTIAITPYVDAITELSEVVEFSVAAGSGYAVGAPATAEVTIADLMPQLSIEAIEPRAIKADQSPGAFLVSRSGATDRSVLVRLQIGGTAVNGVDYNRINSFLSLSANQTAGIIEITPLLNANLQDAKSVQLTIGSDAAYLLGAPTTARVTLVQALTSFPQWRAQHFPQSTNSLAAFAAEDPGSFGVPNLQRYAYGLDALAPDRSHLPQPRLRDGFLTLDLWRRPNATDIDYLLGVSSNLVHWDSTAASVQEIVPSLSADPNVVTFRALPGITNTPQLFFKVRLNYQP